MLMQRRAIELLDVTDPRSCHGSGAASQSSARCACRPRPRWRRHHATQGIAHRPSCPWLSARSSLCAPPLDHLRASSPTWPPSPSPSSASYLRGGQALRRKTGGRGKGVAASIALSRDVSAADGIGSEPCSHGATGSTCTGYPFRRLGCEVPVDGGFPGSGRRYHDNRARTKGVARRGARRR